MLDNEHTRVLILGPALWRAGEGWTGQQPLFAAELPDDEVGHANTTLLTFDELGDLSLRLIRRGIITDGPVCPPPLFTPTLRPNAAWSQLAAGIWPGQAPMPLVLLTRHHETITAHGLVRLAGDSALFLRLGIAGDPDASLVDLFTATLTLAGQHRAGANNHQCCLHDLHPGVELEHKLTLNTPVDLHGVIVDLREHIGDQPGWVWEYRDDWQLWDFDNHLYDITAPAEEAGYVSFIPDSAGTTIVKRKWFHEDHPCRREQRWRGVALAPTDYAAYLVDVFGVEAAQLGSFRRTRFDTTAEARATGNVYGVMADWCRPHHVHATSDQLWQIEIEYLHTRTLQPADPAAAAIHAELEELVRFTRSYLDRCGVAYTTPGESKRTWLRALNSGASA